MEKGASKESGVGGKEEESEMVTSDYYKTKNIPERFNHPAWFKGYNGKQTHPMYRTLNGVYGSRAPSVHTVPTEYHPKSQKFTEHLGKFGMYRNHSLNTSLDTS